MSAPVPIHRAARFVLTTRMGYPNRYAQLYVGVAKRVHSASRKPVAFRMILITRRTLLALPVQFPCGMIAATTGSAHHARQGRTT